jgi:hypothetical protein
MTDDVQLCTKPGVAWYIIRSFVGSQLLSAHYNRYNNQLCLELQPDVTVVLDLPFDGARDFDTVPPVDLNAIKSWVNYKIKELKDVLE